MIPQLPVPMAGPEKIMEAMASFPPKLSALAEVLAEPERLFEEQAMAMGLPVPLGPTRTLAQMLEGIESMAPFPALPAAPPIAPSSLAPTGPVAESLGEAKEVEFIEAKEPTPTRPTGESLGEAKKVEIKEVGVKEVVKKPKEKIEIVEA